MPPGDDLMRRTRPEKPPATEKRRGPEIVLLRPPFYEFEGSRGHSMDIPLGLLSIAAVLESRNYRVSLYDGRVEGQDVALRREHRGGCWVGASWDEIDAHIRKTRPDVAGISCPYTTQAEAAFKLAEVVKGVDRGILTVMGGPYASVRPEEILERCADVDLVVMGEGEYGLCEVMEFREGRRPLGSIEGLAYRSGGRTVRNARRAPIQCLDDLPLPAYHLIDLEKYFELKKKSRRHDLSRPRFDYPGSERSLAFISSRGCPFNCVFCSIHLHMGRRYRAHSAGYVLDHIEHLVSAYGVNHFHFEDDNLTLDRERFDRILDGIEKRGLALTWDTPNGVRADTLDRPLLEKCRRTGCVYLIMGVESGDQHVLDTIIDKKISLARVREVAELAGAIGIDLRSFFVIGFPGETRDQIQNTLAFALDLHRRFRVQPNLMFATPLVGTRLFDICVEKGYLAGPVSASSLAVSTSRRGIIRTEDFDPQALGLLRERFDKENRRIFRANFLKGLLRAPRLIFHILREALTNTRGWRAACADTVLFHHFLNSPRNRRPSRSPGPVGRARIPGPRRDPLPSDAP
jgi:radical SAM superfamily enzyme YgiQ (UPF0313 family)